MRSTLPTLRLAAALAGLASVLAAADVSAQSSGPDLNERALAWSLGRYLSPVLCQIAGAPVRGGRTVVVEPGSRHAHPRVARMVFEDLDAAEATRCFDDLGEPQHNWVGRLEFRLHQRSRPETASYEFRNALKRERGFDFHIVRGTLVARAIGDPDATPQRIDFTGGNLALKGVRIASAATLR